MPVIQQFLNINDSDIIWIKEVLFHYLVWSNIFVENVKGFIEFSNEFLNIKNYEDNKNWLFL